MRYQRYQKKATISIYKVTEAEYFDKEAKSHPALFYDFIPLLEYFLTPRTIAILAFTVN